MKTEISINQRVIAPMKHSKNCLIEGTVISINKEMNEYEVKPNSWLQTNFEMDYFQEEAIKNGLDKNKKWVAVWDNENKNNIFIEVKTEKSETNNYYEVIIDNIKCSYEELDEAKRKYENALLNGE